MSIIGPALGVLQGEIGSVVIEQGPTADAAFYPYIIRGIGADGIANQGSSGTIVGHYNGIGALNITGNNQTLVTTRFGMSWAVISSANRTVSLTGASSVNSDNNGIGAQLGYSYLGSSGVSRYWDGHITKLALWNRALPNAKLQAFTVLGAPFQ